LGICRIVFVLRATTETCQTPAGQVKGEGFSPVMIMLQVLIIPVISMILISGILVAGLGRRLCRRSRLAPISND
jgi:hypothetical protein